MLSFEIREDDLTGPEIVRFLRDHLDYMYAVTPPGSVHAFDLARLLLETGARPEFAPARALYRRYGFEYRGPFADYREDPNSVYMEKRLAEVDVRDRGIRPSDDRS